jgi:hypothetical protein
MLNSTRFSDDTTKMPINTRKLQDNQQGCTLSYSSFEVRDIQPENKLASGSSEIESSADEDETIYSPARPSYSPVGAAISWVSNPFAAIMSPATKDLSSRSPLSKSLDDEEMRRGSIVDESGVNSFNRSFSRRESNGLKRANSSSQFRMVDRDGDFHQSRGKISIRKKIRRSDWRNLYGYDIFHSLVNAPTLRTISVLLLAYFLVVLLFASQYYYISTVYGCHMGIKTFMEAFLFSLETMATVGYGTEDIFFDDCYLPMVVLTLQLLTRIVADAVTIGVIYARLARPTTRASTILFSNFAVIRRIRGKLFFMLQLCELRKHQLLEAHIRLYLIKKERGTNSSGRKDRLYFQTCSMRINHPDDELGGMILMCMPQIVVHELDASSPLMPPPRWIQHSKTLTGKDFIAKPTERVWNPPTYDFALSTATCKETNGVYDAQALNDLAFPSVSVRNPHLSSLKNDSLNNVESNGLKMFSEYFSRHFSSRDEDELDVLDEAPDLHIGEDTGDNIELPKQQEEREMIHDYMRDRQMEIIAVVEGIDSATGGVVQSRHSYVSSEIKWNKTFVPCAYEDDEEGVAVIDFSDFHKLETVYSDSSFPGVFSSML